MFFPFVPGLMGPFLIVCAVLLIPIGLYFAYLMLRTAQAEVHDIDEAEEDTPHTGIRDMQVVTDHGVEHRYENRADD